MRLTLRHKVNGAIVITFFFIALIFALIQLPFQKHWLQRSIDDIEILLQTLVERDMEQLANEIFDSRQMAITMRIEEMRKVNGILAISIFDANGALLVSDGDGPINQDILPAEREKIHLHSSLRNRLGRGWGG